MANLNDACHDNGGIATLPHSGFGGVLDWTA